MNFNITRRQFLQYCTASAAALGLSQTDLLKLEKALATPQTSCSSPTPSVIWMTGQACSGCQTSTLNRVVKVAGGYYDADLVNLLYGASGVAPYPHADVGQGTAADPVGLTLNVVNDAADLLVGDAVRAVLGLGGVPLTRGLNWADDVGSIVPPLPDPNTFPGGYVTLEWLTTVNAGAGDINVDHIAPIVNAGGFVLLLDGAIPDKLKASGTGEEFCWVFDDPNNHSGYGPGPVTLGDALRWMMPQAAAAIAVGTCSAYGGIPGAKVKGKLSNNNTGAMSLTAFDTQEGGFGTPIINVPGCPPHPDWLVHPIAHYLVTGSVCPLDAKGRPKAVYPDVSFGTNCPNNPGQATAGVWGDPNNRALELCDAGCLVDYGCNGCLSVYGDCPVRQKNVFDDGTVNNWCVGSDLGANIGAARHPCQGCIEPGFPDDMSPFYSPDKDGS